MKHNMDLITSLEDIDTQILPYLSPQALITYGCLSKSTRFIYLAYCRRAFDVEKRLEPFFSIEETHEFRQLQAKHGVVISGSFALQFFDRVDYPESDLDIYVQHQLGYDVGVWLQSIGYTFRGKTDLKTAWLEADSSLYPEGRQKAIYDFVRTGKLIQLITSGGSIMQVIIDYHSTCVMNVITHSHAYALYPRATFIDRMTMYTKPATDSRALQALAKYERRGWTRAAYLTGVEAVSSTRRVGDRACWTMQLHGSPDTMCTLTTNTWERIDPIRTAAHFSPHRDLKDRGLNFTYTAADIEIWTFIKAMVAFAKRTGRKTDETLNAIISTSIDINKRDLSYIFTA